MSDIQGDLATALAGRYAIELEAGRGGMAIVFRARDLKHDRPVAIKVLRPELAISLGPERFLREIRVAAHLNHPHILPLHESGEARGLLYYVMPFVEGESLRDRLARDKQLPLEDALRIARDVASALGYAHAHDVVHRDVKPENILLAGGEAVVTDFGIARAISAAGGENITGTGIAIGTPAYMSPEQATAAAEVDGRSDIYSLGCVLYEMVTGHPPFYGSTLQEVLVRHTLDPVPSITAGRRSVPAALEHAVNRALAKSPADRFATAAQFADALVAGAAPPAARGRRRRWLSAAAGVVALAGLALLMLATRHEWGRPSGAPNERVVAVLPFRVSGADRSLGYLREGMIDLLAAKLTGDGGPRAVDPRTMVSAWRRQAGGEDADLPQDAALRLARGIGAGRVLLGAVIGTPTQLVLSASLRSVSGGGSSAEASVQGPSDSLLSLVDQLAAQLLAIGAGEAPQRLSSATSTSLRALRFYLDGQAAYRRGHYVNAVQFFDQALTEDSTFALAALGLRSAAGWIGSPEANRGARLAWGLRSRLSARDRAILIGLVGPRFPDLSSEKDVLSAWEEAVTAAPDQPEAWYELGDQLYHSGDMLGVDANHAQAAAAFRRAVELDSTFAAPLAHQVELAARRDGRAQLRRLATLYFAVDSVGEVADYLRWRVAVATGDSVALAALRGRMADMSVESLRRIVVAVQLDGIPTDDADRAAAAWLASIDAPGLRWLALLRLHDLALNEGHPTMALALTDSLRALRPRSDAYLRIRVGDAMFGDGDATAAAEAVARLARMADAPVSGVREERAEQYADLCTVERWRLAHGDTRTTARAIARLHASTGQHDSPEIDTNNRWCAITLDALLAATRSPGATGPSGELDSLMLTGPRPIEIWNGTMYQNFTYANLAASRLREARGDLAGALAAARRRPYHGAGAAYLATFLRQEGRLAALTGDAAGAIHAYRHYLALRRQPERALEPEVAQVRDELERLEATRRP